MVIVWGLINCAKHRIVSQIALKWPGLLRLLHV
jgi:hypothetical protein